MFTHTVNIENLTRKEMFERENYEAAHSSSLLGRFNAAITRAERLNYQTNHTPNQKCHRL